MTEIRIDHLWHKKAFGLWVMDWNGGIGRIAKPIRLEMEPTSVGAMLPPPTLEIPSDQAKPLFASFMKEFIRHGMGVDPDKTQGLYEAQSKHLADLQKLVFKGK